MNSPSVRHVFWAAAALVLLLAAAPVLVAHVGPADRAGGATIDHNAASQAGAGSLPGVDPASPKPIIAGRPYAFVADLSKAALPAGAIEEMAPLVKVGPLETAAAATEMGARKTAAGIGKGADATAKGVEKGVSAASKGVRKAAAVTASAAENVDWKVTGAPRQPPQAGMVWANAATMIYHKEGDASCGTTKNGKWLTEREALKEGYHAAKLNEAREKEQDPPRLR
jgi:hypothetical protein